MTTRKLTAAVIVAGLSLSAGMASATAADAAQRPAHCTEDMACWTWPRMGNGRRAVVTMWGTPKVVTCGDMRWLVRHGDLDERSTPWLRGDYSCGRRR